MQIELGKMQELTVVKKVDFGVYLAPEDNREDKVLLPGKQVPEGCGLGDRITVFVYRDSRDRLISTTTKPVPWRGGGADRGTDGKAGRFSGLGPGKGSFSAVQGTDETRPGRGKLSCGVVCG